MTLTVQAFYEYLLKAHMFAGEAYIPYLERWKLVADSTIQYIASHPFGHPEWSLLPSWEYGKLVKVMDVASWSAGGTFILGGLVTSNQTLIDFGITIADTAGAISHVTTTGLGAESIVWTDDCAPSFMERYRLDECNASTAIQITSPEYKLRPQVIETWYYAYQATKDPKYRDWAWSAVQTLLQICKTPSGFSAISDVTAVAGGAMLDEMEHLPELLMYLWLVHNEVRTAILMSYPLLTR